MPVGAGLLSKTQTSEEEAAKPATRLVAAGMAAAPQGRPLSAVQQAALYSGATTAPPHYARAAMPAPMQPPAAGPCNCEHCRGGVAVGNALPGFRFEEEPGLPPAGHPYGDPNCPPGPVPWPEDEYLWNGCDLNENAHVRANYVVHGLELQDTIVHYDTEQGTTEVCHSNCVPIYAPRFAATRKTTTPILYEGHERMAGVEKPDLPVVEREMLPPGVAIQPIPPVGQVGLKQLQVFREQNRGVVIEQPVMLIQVREGYLPNEDLQKYAIMIFENGEKPRFTELIQAALVWQHELPPQVIVDARPVVESKEAKLPLGFHVYERDAIPCIKICKVASRADAQPGDIIDFMLKVENVGDQTLERVTILDNLVTRLAYIETSAECSIPHTFSTCENQGDSLTLRWELHNPLPPGHHAFMRFQCRMR
jgi:uncharacterized repeat protein (TIGR01451 family)